eukprot:EG_transcript_5537
MRLLVSAWQVGRAARVAQRRSARPRRYADRSQHPAAVPAHIPLSAPLPADGAAPAPHLSPNGHHQRNGWHQPCARRPDGGEDSGAARPDPTGDASDALRFTPHASPPLVANPPEAVDEAPAASSSSATPSPTPVPSPSPPPPPPPAAVVRALVGHALQGDVEGLRRCLDAWLARGSDQDPARQPDGPAVFVPNSLVLLQTFTQAIRQYGDAGQLDRAETLFWALLHAGVRPPAPMWNALLQPYAAGRHFAKAQALVAAMLEGGVPCDRVTFNLLLSICGRAGDLASLEGVLHAMGQQGLELDQAGYNAVLDAHGRAGDLPAVEQTLQAMQAAGLKPDAFTYQALIQGFVATDRLADAEVVLDAMRASGFPPRGPQYTTLLTACARLGDVERLQRLQAAMPNDGVPLDSPICGCLIGAYAATNWLGPVHRLERDVRRQCPAVLAEVGHLFVRAYSRRWGKVDRFLSNLRGVPNGTAGLTPALLTAAVEAYVYGGRVDRAAALVDRYLDLRLPVTLPALRALFEAYRRRRLADPARQLLQRLSDGAALPPEDLDALQAMIPRPLSSPATPEGPSDANLRRAVAAHRPVAEEGLGRGAAAAAAAVGDLAAGLRPYSGQHHTSPRGWASPARVRVMDAGSRGDGQHWLDSLPEDPDSDPLDMMVAACR